MKGWKRVLRPTVRAVRSDQWHSVDIDAMGRFSVFTKVIFRDETHGEWASRWSIQTIKASTGDMAGIGYSLSIIVVVVYVH